MQEDELFFDHRLLFGKCTEGIKERNRRERVRERGGGIKERGGKEGEGKRGRKAEEHLLTIINSVLKLFLSPGSQQ